MGRAVALAVLALLAACATPPEGGPPSAALPPGAGLGTGIGSGTGSAAAPQADAEAEANVPLDQLLHVRTGELRARFGDPHAQRRDGGAIVWNYEADGLCRLNLVLQGVRGAPAEVVHAQARIAEGGSEAACLDRLRQEARVSAVPVIETVATAPPPAPPRAAARRRPPAGPRAAVRPAPRPAASRPAASRPAASRSATVRPAAR